MICNTCGNQRAYRWRKHEDGTEYCNACSDIPAPWLPDVHFQKPYLDHNLAHPDRPRERNGVWVESKRHKAMLLNEQNLREAGDRRRGAINFDRTLHRRLKDRG